MHNHVCVCASEHKQMRTRCKLKFGQALIKFLGTGDSATKFIGWLLWNWQGSHSRRNLDFTAETRATIELIKLYSPLRSRTRVSKVKLQPLASFRREKLKYLKTQFSHLFEVRL
jgi:hypothetical protein